MSCLLVIAPSAYPLGGVAEWLDYILPGLERNGWRCVLALVQGVHHDAAEYLARHPWHDSLVISNPTGSAEGRVQAVMHMLQTVNPDVLGIVNIACAYEAIRRMRLRGWAAPKAAMTLHALEPEFFEDIAAQPDVLDAVIVTNRLAQQLAQLAIGVQERVLYAPCGVAPGEATRSRLLVLGICKLLYCGRFDEGQKRILDLVSLGATLAARGLRWKISLAGSGPDEHLLRGAIAARGLDSFFDFLGVLEPAALHLEYERHDALVITSTWETGPIVAWEAMSHGLPVIASRYLGSGLEGALVDRKNCLLFPIGDTTACADAVQDCMSADIRSLVIEGGKTLVRHRYSRDASVSAWTEALDYTMKLPPLPRPEPKTHQTVPGRLDRLLGAAWGERARRALGVSYRHAEAGGEWPHTNSIAPSREEFQSRARGLDFPMAERS